MTIAVTSLYTLMYFPQWGGMFTKAKEGVTEEDYYLAEWTPEERSQVRDTQLQPAALTALKVLLLLRTTSWLFWRLTGCSG